MNHLKEQQHSLKTRPGGRAANSEHLDAVGKQFANLSRHINAGCFAIASVLPKGKLEVVRIELTCLDRRDEHSRIVDDLKLYAEASAWLALRDNESTGGVGSGTSNGTANGLANSRSPERQSPERQSPERQSPERPSPEQKLPEQRPQLAAAPLPDAVFEGYPGVLLAYRDYDDRRYSAEDLQRLAVCAEEISDSVRKARRQDASANAAIAAGDMPASQRFIALDADQRPWMNADEFNAMDEQLRSNLLQAVSQLSPNDGDEPSIEDTEVTDSLGRLRTVRLVVRPQSHGQGNGHVNGHSNGSKSRKQPLSASPEVLCCFTPPASDWMRLRPDDFTADTETKRLIPAIHFMTRDVGDQPGLYEIADSVGLSPFHFHRRFTELFGVTPKQILLTSQIGYARQLLSQPNQALAEIARVCGFAHQSHFTSRFKQATGLTPTRWRKMINAQSAGQNASS